MTYLVRILDGDGNFELINKDFLGLYPDLNQDDLIELSDEQYQEFCQRDNGKTKFIDGQFVFTVADVDEQAVVKQYPPHPSTVHLLQLDKIRVRTVH